MAGKGRKLILGMTLGFFAVLTLAGYVLLQPPLPQVPEIARDLPPSFVDADRVFSERIKNAFPLNMDEAVLTKKLAEQGFTVVQGTRMATFSQPGLVCNLKWRIAWEADQTVVTKINGNFNGICL